MAVHDESARAQTWVAAGLISAEQARAIVTFEAERTSTVRAATLPRWVEPVAYVGEALVAVALLLFGVEVWDSITAWARVALATVITLCLLVAGLLLQRSAEPAAQRAASFTWLLGLAGVASVVGLLSTDVLAASEETVAVATTAATLLMAATLYVAMRRVLQQIGLAVAAAALLIAILTTTASEDPRLVAVVLTGLGAVWLVLARAGWLLPAQVAWAIGSLLVLSIGFGSVEGGTALWSGMGVAVAVGLVGLATALDSRWVLAVGLLGLLVWIPQTVALVFEGSLAVPLAILVTGVMALAVAVAAVRRR